MTKNLVSFITVPAPYMRHPAPHPPFALPPSPNMHPDSPAPRIPAIETAINAASHSQRTRSFNIDEFNDLVSIALDTQRLPDSSLAFTFNATANMRSPHMRQVTVDAVSHSKVAKTFKDAFRWKGAMEGASERHSATRHPYASRLPEARRLASPSVPALSPTVNVSRERFSSPSLININEYDSDDNSLTDLMTRAPDTPAMSFGQHHTGPYDLWLQQDSPACDAAHQSNVPCERARTKSAHRTFFKSLPFAKLKRKSSRLLFSSGSPPSPSVLNAPPDMLPARNIAVPHSESDGLRSFFDDSGFEEVDLASLPVVRKVKSRPGIRRLFSATSALYGSTAQANPDVRHVPSKPLPPIPTVPSAELQTRDKAVIVQIPIPPESFPTSARGRLEKPRHEYASPFYAPPSLPYRPAPRPRKSAQEMITKERAGLRLRPINNREHSPFERLSRSMDLVRVPVRIRSRYSPSPYPNPTAPLPPTPDMLPTQLLLKNSGNSRNSLSPLGRDRDFSEDMSHESADQSIDSVEILSWRTKGMEKRLSKTSSGSAHARGKPSRNSIRERFGLGPQLHIHVSGSEVEKSQFMSQDDLQDYMRTRTTSILTLRPNSRVNTSGDVSTVRTLTSTSAGSLLDSLNECSLASSSTSDAGGYLEAFDLGDDPFAADPLSTAPVPLTPPSPSKAQSSPQGMKLRSFIPVEDYSKLDPSSAPEVPTLWNSLLRPRRSSPALATSLNTVSPGLSGYSSTVSSSTITTPSSRRSGLPPSLIDALGTEESTSSPFGSPRRQNPSLNLNQLLLRTRGLQRIRKDSTISKLSYASEDSISGGSAGFLGHSDSRPHSPFPLLFFRSGASKPSPITREAHLGSTPSESSSDAEPKSSHGNSGVQTPLRSSFPVEELQPISAEDADAFGDACRRYSQLSVYPSEFNTLATSFDKQNKELLLKEAEQTEGLGLIFDNTAEPRSTATRSERIDASEGSQEEEVAEADVETDNEDSRMSKQVWPLPPHRTVVLDEESGEGWHEVDQIIEHVPLHAAIPDAPRHTIRLPMTSRTGSSCGNSTRSSSSGSIKSRRLDAHQARKIIETISNNSEQRSQSSHTSPEDDLPVTSSRRSLSVDSDLSFLSSETGSRSTKTCGSAYYSIRSSYSFRSKKSFSRSAALRRGMVPTDNSPVTPTSHRPGSSRSAKSPTLPSFTRDRSASYSSSVTSGSLASVRITVANKRVNPDALPRHVSLGDDALMNTITIAADGWTQLMTFCTQHEGIVVEAGKGVAMLWISIEEVIVSASDADFYLPGIPGGLSNPTIHVLMTLTLNAPKQEEKDRDTPVRTCKPDLTFCLPLPVTLGEVAEHSRRSSVGEGFMRAHI